jgi:hypothetical protein
VGQLLLGRDSPFLTGAQPEFGARWDMGGVGHGPDPARILPELRSDIAMGRLLGPTVDPASAKANDPTLTRGQDRIWCRSVWMRDIESRNRPPRQGRFERCDLDK